MALERKSMYEMQEIFFTIGQIIINRTVELNPNLFHIMIILMTCC